MNNDIIVLPHISNNRCQHYRKTKKQKLELGQTINMDMCIGCKRYIRQFFITT